MDVLPLLFVTKLGMIALAAFYVRVQLSLLRGFDLGLAAIALVAGDVLVGLANQTLPIALALTSAVLIGGVIGAIWTAVVLSRTDGLRDAGGAVLIAGLGLASMAAGLIGATRGAGLVQLDAQGSEVLGVPFSFVLAISAVLVGTLVAAAWRLSRTGLVGSLLDQDRAFASEMGLSSRGAAAMTGLATGSIAAAAGAAQACLNGSSPTSGMSLFIFGAAAALIFVRAGFTAVILGAAIVAALDIFISYTIQPLWTEALTFGVLLCLLMWRGFSSSQEEIR